VGLASKKQMDRSCLKGKKVQLLSGQTSSVGSIDRGRVIKEAYLDQMQERNDPIPLDR